MDLPRNNTMHVREIAFRAVSLGRRCVGVWAFCALTQAPQGAFAQELENNFEFSLEEVDAASPSLDAPAAAMKPEPKKASQRVERTTTVDLGPEIRAAYAPEAQGNETLFSSGLPLSPLRVVMFDSAELLESETARFTAAARVGMMIPTPWIEQPAWAASVDFGYAILPFLWLMGEVGFEYSTADNLSESFDLPYGRLRTAAEFHQWSLPIMLGARVSLRELLLPQLTQLELATSLHLGLVYEHASFKAVTPTGPFVDDESSGVAPMMSLRAEVGWHLGPGAVVVSAAWRQDLMWEESDTAKRWSTGLNLEAGWRHFF